MFKKTNNTETLEPTLENKKTKNMKDRFILFFKEEWKFLLFLLIFYFLLTYEFPFVIYTPGGAINMSERISGENTYKEEGSLSMTYVSMLKGTVPFLALSYIVPNWDITPSSDVTYDDLDLKETIEIDKIHMKEAISNAEYVAYTHAGIKFEETNIHNVVTYVNKDAKTNIKYGDEILSVDGIKYTTLKEFQNYIGSKNIGDKVKLEYKREDETKTEDVELIGIDGVAKVGMSIASISDYKTDYNIEVKTKSSESGPSGGFITTLAIYNAITEDDLTDGKKIMGTGTIDKEGHVGVIGGVKYKLLGAYDEGAEVFICPKENYEDALKVKNEENMDIILLSAETFDEAVEKLKQLK